jgi:hypothetical protein
MKQTHTTEIWPTPTKKAETTPWDKLCVDLVGPYKIQRKGKEDLICRCVTMIDPATGWFEIQRYDDKQSITVANIIEQQWFSRYPRPVQVTFDRGRQQIHWPGFPENDQR